MIFNNTFICTGTDNSYFIRGQFNCGSINLLCLIICSECLEEYAGPAVKFKTRFASKNNLITEQKRNDVEVPDILIIIVIILLIPLAA